MGKKTERARRGRGLEHICGLHDTAARALSAEELAGGAQQGCKACFAELVRRYSGRLLRFLHQRIGNTQDAEDVVQETFVRAYQNIGRYRSYWKFSTWLFTIASRLASSHYRRMRPLQTAGPIECDKAGPADVVGQAEERQNLWAAAKSLPRNQHEALWLRYAEDMSISQIAKVMRKSQVNVKVLLYRARKNLARRFRSEVQEDRTAEQTSSDETLPFMKVEGA